MALICLCFVFCRVLYNFSKLSLTPSCICTNDKMVFGISEFYRNSVFISKAVKIDKKYFNILLPCFFNFASKHIMSTQSVKVQISYQDKNLTNNLYIFKSVNFPK